MAGATRRDFLRAAGAAGAAALLGRRTAFGASPAAGRAPNIILVLADDLGYGDVGCYGQPRIKTPAIDVLARQGARFTQAYSGSPVCAPSRCVLMTGRHSGHAFVRDNREIEPEGQIPLPAGTPTIPGLLRSAGYATALVGKWGLGYPGSPGEPNAQGFDYFFGFNCQRQAHNYYPAYLWRNREKVVLAGNSDGVTGAQYAPDLFEAEGLRFIRANKDRPFFLEFATTIPHLALQVPEDSLAEYRGLWDDPPYDGKAGYQPQRSPRAAYAAMVTRLDRSVGRIAALLEELGLEESTLVIVTSDNGASFPAAGYDPAFFGGTGPFRGTKGSVYEGGIRVPLVVRWPGRVRPGTECGRVTAFEDFLPTLLAAAGAARAVPAGTDGISFLPALLGSGRQAERPFLYMEFEGFGGQVMVRLGDWKGVRRDLAKNPAAPLELYDLSSDIGETKDVAAAHPDIAARMTGIIRAEHRPSKEFPLPALDGLR